MNRMFFATILTFCVLLISRSAPPMMIDMYPTISRNDIEGQERDIVRADPVKLVELGFLRCKTKNISSDASETFIPLIPNQPQRRFLKLFRELQSQKIPIRIVILKCRQWGGTTIVDAIMYALTSQRPNVNSMILSDDRAGASYILDMSQNFHHSLVSHFPHLAEPVKRSNKIELAFEYTKSNIFIDSAENRDAGQKYTLHNLHCSEVAKFHYTDELFKGLLPAVSKSPGSFVVLESTANGVGDYFYKIVKQAESRSGEWVLFFVSWMEYEEYTRPFANNAEKQRLIDTLDDEERMLLALTYPTIDGPKTPTYEQLNWRRWIIANEMHGDLDSFHEMYPSTVDEAFLVSGRPRFDAQKVKKIYEYTLTQKPHQGVLEFASEKEIASGRFTTESVLFHADSRGEWRIWEFPDQRTEYVISVDTAGGEEVEGTAEGKKGDYNVIHIYRRGDQLVQVAEYRSRIDPDLLAEEAYMAHLAYRKPIVFPEVNNHGRTFVDRLKHRCPVYHREIMDEYTRKLTKKIGWFTDKSNKKIMIDTLAEAIRDGWIVIRSSVCASELRTYVKGSDGTTNAQQGCFDDTVMTAALGIQAHLRTPRAGDFKVIRTESSMARG